MINRAFEEIEFSDIARLVEQQTIERRNLDYKLVLPGNTSDEKREFLADVASFANAGGGDIIFGIEDARDEVGRSTGIPAAIIGLRGINVESELLRLENLCRDSIAPRIVGLRMRAVDTASQNPVLILRVPASFQAPHMLTAGGRFYSRNNAGKYPLDVNEIRAAFVGASTLPEQLSQFRAQRVARIVADELPTRLEGSTRMILHLLPLSAFATGLQVPLNILAYGDLPQIRGDVGMLRWNFEGLLQHQASASYVQIFRSGAIEAVDSTTLSTRDVIPSTAIEHALISTLDKYRKTLKKLELEEPYAVFVSLIGLEERHRLGVPESVRWSMEGSPLGHRSLLFPNLLVVGPDQSSDSVLRPAFDMLWQAAGYERCFNYDEDGNRLSN